MPLVCTWAIQLLIAFADQVEPEPTIGAGLAAAADWAGSRAAALMAAVALRTAATISRSRVPSLEDTLTSCSVPFRVRGRRLAGPRVHGPGLAGKPVQVPAGGGDAPPLLPLG